MARNPDRGKPSPGGQREPIGERELSALTRSILAQGLVQLALHFPDALVLLRLSAAEALEQALALAEEAIALAPRLPDGHAALGRVLLCHPHEDAVRDAVEVLEHALRLDPAHDPATIALAVALREQGELRAALTAVNKVLRRGNSNPHPLLLRAQLHLDLGRKAEARRDLDRAVRVAPRAGVVHLEAARLALAAGDREAATAYARQHAAGADVSGEPPRDP